MTARTIVGAFALAVLLGVTVYLLLQIPAVFAIGGVVALAGIFAAVSPGRPRWPRTNLPAVREGGGHLGRPLPDQ